MNKQEPEKKSHRDDGMLQVHSIFYTIQGEGPFAGTPAVFIRLAGCNLQCPGCDTDYTSKRSALHYAVIADMAQLRLPFEFPKPGYNNPLVVITGGEPFRQDIGKLAHMLVSRGFFVQIETNGTLPAPDILYNSDIASRSGIYVVCSPKTGQVHGSVERVACAYKYVMSADRVDPSDGLPTLALYHAAHKRVARPPRRIKLIYLQPMDSSNILWNEFCTDEIGRRASNKENLDACIKSCMQHGYILQLQIHKIIGME